MTTESVDWTFTFKYYIIIVFFLSGHSENLHKFQFFFEFFFSQTEKKQNMLETYFLKFIYFIFLCKDPWHVRYILQNLNSSQ